MSAGAGGRRAPRTFRKDAAPEGYVAGLGRGAVAFTTRSDAVPLAGGAGRGAGRGAGPLARTDFGAAPKGYVAGAGRGAGGFGETKPSAESVRDTHTAAADAAGEDPDEAWDAVERRIAERNAKKRRRRETESNGGVLGGMQGGRVADQFADLKQQLKTVSYAEWDAIPEARSGVREHRQQETFTPVSDALLLSSAGLASQGSANARSIERGRALLSQIDGQGDKQDGSSAFDPGDYLASLDDGANGASAAARVGDVRKARLLFRSVTTSNPSHGPGWIAAARLEEVAGKLLDARKIIAEGCKACPTSEDVWLEAARLNTPANAKVILGDAIRHLPRAVKLWLRAADLEGDHTERKKRVLRRALETLPKSEQLWKAAIELEDNEADAHLLLARATECVPTSVDLWLALAQLEDYKQARAVLQTARKRLPREPKIWVAACALEEAQVVDTVGHNGSKTDSKVPEPSDDAALAKLRTVLDKIVTKAVNALKTTTMRADWLEHAREMEGAGSLETCRAIIRGTMSLGVPAAEQKRTWFADASAMEKEGLLVCARSLYAEAMSLFPGHKDVLLRAVAFESRKGDKASLTTLLHEAVQRCPKAELFWLMAAKETWKTLNDPREARRILDRALASQHNTERVWLAAFKLEWETGNVKEARSLLKEAQTRCPTPRIWVKAALLERVELSKAELGSDKARTLFAQAFAILKEGYTKFPTFYKLWLMAGQLQVDFRARHGAPGDRQDAVQTARKLFLDGLKHCPHGVPLWLGAARLEREFVSPVKARSVLELARVKNADQPALWLEAIRLETEQGQHGMAEALKAKAVQACPKAGVLWAYLILTAPRPEQRAKSADAMERCENDAHVFCALGRLFASRNKVPTARKWFEAAVTANDDFGDAWGYYLHFERSIASDADAAEQVLRRCLAAEPHHGELWQQVVKRDALRLATDRERLEAVVLECASEFRR
ncbi:Pre-mRNA-processing factor 6 [Hondaea fermentalgiana]|uniref:Pre-mRNA-processing factor 6 n=1 Tax=Hondaea fermentalgiana TaxID=2315210 RepID=A0A2R5G9Z8_9STRA|nr:Pre-mRNA-processing factor 6 [Hondaea fermentalgiana]|eukprot:GBG24911.1 Pre-mRNA-processing factor 6 [Hondaea fermentalgiana]